MLTQSLLAFIPLLAFASTQSILFRNYAAHDQSPQCSGEPTFKGSVINRDSCQDVYKRVPCDFFGWEIEHPGVTKAGVLYIALFEEPGCKSKAQLFTETLKPGEAHGCVPVRDAAREPIKQYQSFVVDFAV